MTIADAEAEEREAIAAIGALGEAELVAVKAWVASGCEGPKPEPDAEARRVLADRLMAAIEARQAARCATDRSQQAVASCDNCENLNRVRSANEQIYRP